MYLYLHVRAYFPYASELVLPLSFDEVSLGIPSPSLTDGIGTESLAD